MPILQISPDLGETLSAYKQNGCIDMVESNESHWADGKHLLEGPDLGKG